MRDGGLFALFKVQVPDVAIDQSDNDCRAKKHEHCADVIPKFGRNSVNPHRRVKGQRETEESEKETELNACPSLEKTADGERD